MWWRSTTRGQAACSNGRPAAPAGGVGVVSVMKDEHGAFAIEVTVLAPLLLVLVFLTFEFGRVFGSWLVLTNAAREGARVGIAQNWCAPGTTCTASDNVIVQRVAATAQFLTVQTTTACTVSGNSSSAPATNASLPSGQTSCVAVVRYVDSNGDHVLQVWAIYQVQTLMPIARAVPFFGTLGYPSTLSVAGLSNVRSTQ
jgi:Flp pilus assembly protein TadG